MANRHVWVEDFTGNFNGQLYTCPAGFQAVVVSIHSNQSSSVIKVNNGINLSVYDSATAPTFNRGEKIVLESGDVIGGNNVGLAIIEIPLAADSAEGNFLSIPSFNNRKQPDQAPYYSFTNITMPSTQTWSNVAYGNGVFVAISSGFNGFNAGMTNSNVGAISHDGINWTEVTLPASVLWNDIVFGNGLFVIKTYSTNERAVSSDGVNWTYSNSNFVTSGGIDFSKMSYGNGVFVLQQGLTTLGSNAYVSTNGLDWTEHSRGVTSYIRDTAFGNGKFVSIPGRADTTASYNYVMVSSDGKNWEQVITTGIGGHNHSAIAFGNGKFVAVGNAYFSTSANLVSVSSDGINWTQSSVPEFNNDKISNVTFANGVFVATTGLYTSSYSNVYTSVDGINWTVVPLGVNGHWHACAYGNGIWVTMSGGYSNTTATNYLRVSLDNAQTWVTSGNSPDRSNKVYNLNDKSLITSVDYLLSADSLYNSTISSLEASGVSSIKYFNNKFYATQVESDKLLQSNDGVTWSETTLPITANWTDITYDGTAFVIIADSLADAYRSTDGTTWSAVPLSVGSPLLTEKWSSISNINGVMTIIAFDSAVMLSSTDNGVTWTADTLFESVYKIYKTANALIMPIKNSRTAYVSTNGSTWEITVLPASVYKMYDHGDTVILESLEHKLYTTTDGFVWRSYKSVSDTAMPTKIVPQSDGSSVLEVFDTADSSFKVV